MSFYIYDIIKTSELIIRNQCQISIHFEMKTNNWIDEIIRCK